ncbi:hypothetical protein F2P81_025468 [Scophthalmus maximus]|uniref:Uncharacterized protein n=1 Tax=Scophthalmus maximus TaxID=52904 RepID=A0A6A4RTG0_SCOMX|nr:hypothetical protein F2P81_025468 [Scophthalmus maximus]
MALLDPNHHSAYKVDTLGPDPQSHRTQEALSPSPGQKLATPNPPSEAARQHPTHTPLQPPHDSSNSPPAPGDNQTHPAPRTHPSIARNPEQRGRKHPPRLSDRVDQGGPER